MRIQWLIDNANTTLFNDMCIKRKHKLQISKLQFIFPILF